MELKGTIELMQSEDYKERFKAEYYQLSIRKKKLEDMLAKWDAGELEFTPTCPRGLYDGQVKAMTEYLACLEVRAAAEHVDL